MEAVTAADIAAAASTTADPDCDEYAVVTSARENGSATRTGDSLFDRPDSVQIEDTGSARSNGTFYDVSETALERPEVTVYEVCVGFEPDDSTPDLGAIESDDLPAVDREHLEPFVSEDQPFGGRGSDFRVEYGTVEEVGNGSVFVPDRRTTSSSTTGSGIGSPSRRLWPSIDTR